MKIEAVDKAYHLLLKYKEIERAEQAVRNVVQRGEDYALRFYSFSIEGYNILFPAVEVLNLVSIRKEVVAEELRRLEVEV